MPSACNTAIKPTHCRDLLNTIAKLLLGVLGLVWVGSVSLAQEEAPVAGAYLDFSHRALSVPEPGTFPDRIQAASQVMYAVWSQWIGPDRIRPARVELLLLGDRLEFDRLKQRMAPELPPVSGFYATATDQAIVLYDETTPDNNRFTALHEVAHLISYSQVGPLDRWLAEGLAEYFETLEVDEGAARVSPNLRYQAVLKRQPLVEFLELPLSAWQGDSVEQYYAAAWSLVYFLMETPRGRVALREVLVRMTSPLRRQLAERELLDLSYPGGLENLELDWHRWLQAADFRPQTLLEGDVMSVAGPAYVPVGMMPKGNLEITNK